MALTGGSDKHFYAIDFSFLLLGGDPAKIAAFLDMAIDSGDPASPLIQIVVWESPFDLSWVSACGRLAARGLSTRRSLWSWRTTPLTTLHHAVASCGSTTASPPPRSSADSSATSPCCSRSTQTHQTEINDRSCRSRGEPRP